MASGGDSPLVRYTSGVYGRANVSTKKKEDAKEAGPRFPPSAPAVLEDNTADWSHAEWEKLFQRCVPNLWIYLYVPFLVSFMIVWLLSNYTRTMFDVDVIVSSETNQRSVTMGRSKAIYLVAAANFAIGVFVQLSGMAFQISLKKRILNSFVAYISMVACTVYLAKASSLFPDFKALDGKPTQFLRYYAWANSTPMMLTTIAALGGSMQDNLIPDWRLLRTTLLWNWVMLASGMVHSYTQHALVMTSWIFFSLSGFCLMMVFYQVHLMTKKSIENAGTSHEILSLRGVQYLTYVFWSLFPLVDMAHQLGFLDSTQAEICMVVVDVLTKNVYSVTLLSGNFCVLDMVATIRIAQISTDVDKKRTIVVNAEAVKTALQTAVIEAETAARLSRRFLANMSHELRTPLNSVIAFNSLLLEAEDLKPVYQDFVRSTVTSAEALLGIINQVLEHSRLEGFSEANKGLVELDEAPFNLKVLCDDLCDILGSRAAYARVDFAISCPDLWGPSSDSLLWLHGDGFRVRQVIIILCDNAIKFAKEVGGQALVSIKAGPWINDEDFVQLVLQVSDNGVGIALGKLDTVFKPFVQANQQDQAEGKGLGLAICQKIVRSMGGSVSVKSVGLGKGSTFTVELLMPRAEAPPGTVIDTPQRRLSGKAQLVLPAGPTRDVLKSACAWWGIEVEGEAVAADASSTTVAHVLSLMEQEQRTRPDVSLPAKQIFVVDAQLYIQLYERSPAIAARSPTICLGFLTELNELRQKQCILLDRVQIAPVKLAGLRAKMHTILTMPLSVHHISSGEEELSRVSSGRAMPWPGKKAHIPRVLVTDDQPVNQKVAVAMLRKILGEDAIIRLACNGKECLDMATSGGVNNLLSFDIILMDVQMPFMDGLEATRRIRTWEASRSDGRSYFITAMTAHASQSDIDECINSGMNRYTSKPVNMSIFRTVLEEYSVWKRTQP